MIRAICSCDMCKRVCEESELISISFAKSGDSGLKHLSERGLMQGTRLGDEDLCPECYQKLCWAFANLMENEIKPHNPVKENLLTTHDNKRAGEGN